MKSNPAQSSRSKGLSLILIIVLGIAIFIVLTMIITVDFIAPPTYKEGHPLHKQITLGEPTVFAGWYNFSITGTFARSWEDPNTISLSNVNLFIVDDGGRVSFSDDGIMK